MTVTYTREVSDCKGFGCFWKLLFRWRGSIYKLVWPDLIAYSFLYFLFSAIYRFVLNEEGRKTFEMVAMYTQHFTDLIPIAFVLGFYVSIVVQRWWSQYESLPWPDSLSLYISTSIPGNDNRARIMRRTIVRYANLAFTLTLIMISPRVKKRFPSMDHLVEAGLLMANEKKIMEDMQAKSTHPLYWMPLVWAGTVVARARKEGRIRDDFAVKTIVDEINRLRGLCGTLLSYDWISIPLVYTQVVTLAVYTFFLSTLMGRQFLDPVKKYDKHDVDLYFPIFTYLQFFFYMGWLKVAETLVNPFGEDDDDFEVNWLVDRNLQVSYLIVDEMHNEHPELIQDIYWDEVFPQELPYTIAAQEFRTEPPQGSTANMEVPIDEQDFLPTMDEEINDEMGTPTLSINHFRKVGSTLSNMLQPSSYNKRNSIRSFIQRAGSTSSMLRVPTAGRNLHRSFSKSSATNANQEDKDQRRFSEASLSGSDDNATDHQLVSSKESIPNDSPSRQRKRFKKRSCSGDDGIITINIKNRREEKPATTIEISSPEEKENEPLMPISDLSTIKEDYQNGDLANMQNDTADETSIFKLSPLLPEKTKHPLTNRLSLSSLKSFRNAAEDKGDEDNQKDGRIVTKLDTAPQIFGDNLKTPSRNFSISSLNEETNSSIPPFPTLGSNRKNEEQLVRQPSQNYSNDPSGRKYQPRGPLLLGLSAGLPITLPEKMSPPSLPIEIKKRPRDSSPYRLSPSPENQFPGSSPPAGHKRVGALNSSELETVNEQAENDSTSLL